MTLIISIGRNVGDEPMEDARWSRFKGTIWLMLHDYGDIVFHGEGVGVYEGLTEESYSVILVADHWRAADEAELKIRLRTLARVYQQEAIALTIGTTQFVEGSTV